MIRACATCSGIFRSDFLRCPIDGGEVREVDVDPNIGRTVDGRYLVGACVGQGAMGRVYEVRHTRMGRKLALKMMYGDLAAEGTMRARFEREAKAASRLDHPRIVSVTDFGEAAGIHFLTMELLEGRTVRELLEEEGPLPESVVMAIVEQIAEGLEHAHARGVVHRDLKPENLFILEASGVRSVKIVDFGIAYSLATHDQDERLTELGRIVGTPAFMAPEQALGDPVDGRADLFSLGMTMFFMLAGRPPYGGDVARVLHRLTTEGMPDVTDVNPAAWISPRCRRILADLTALVPERRVSSATALLDRISASETGGRATDSCEILPGPSLPAKPEARPGLFGVSSPLKWARRALGQGRTHADPPAARTWALIVGGLAVGFIGLWSSSRAAEPLWVGRSPGPVESPGRTELRHARMLAGSRNAPPLMPQRSPPATLASKPSRSASNPSRSASNLSTSASNPARLESNSDPSTLGRAGAASAGAEGPGTAPISSEDGEDIGLEVIENAPDVLKQPSASLASVPPEDPADEITRVDGEKVTSDRVEAGGPVLEASATPQPDSESIDLEGIDAAPSLVEFREVYREVGERLEAATATRSAAAFGALRDRYFAVSYVDALRSADARAAAVRELESMLIEVDELGLSRAHAESPGK